MSGRFDSMENGAERAVEGGPLRIADVQLVPDVGVEVEAVERTPETYPDIQISLATIDNRVDFVTISDPLFAEPYVLKRGELEHEVFSQQAVQRLFFVDQFGWRHAVAATVNVHPHTRGEHSLAVGKLIVDKLQGRDRPSSDLLRIAAITHDIGQTAFSHHGEAAFDRDKAQSWHDQRRLAILESPEPDGLADFLERHGLTADELMAEYENPILDVDRPDLCADRIEYLVRDGMAHGDIDSQEAQLLIEAVQITIPTDAEKFRPLPGEEVNLTPEGLEELNRLSQAPDRPVWVCNSLAAAETYYLLMERLNSVYTGAEMGTIKMYTSNLLRAGMERGYLTTEQIQTGTDDAVMRQLAEAVRSHPDDEEFREKFAFLVQLGKPQPRPKVEAFILRHRPKIEELQTPDIATTKQRWVDPFVEKWVEVEGPKMLQVIRRLSYYKQLGYQVEGDLNSNPILKSVAKRLRPQRPKYQPIIPRLAAKPRELQALEPEQPGLRN